MAQIVELVQRGVFLDGLSSNVSSDVSALTFLMTGCVTDSVLSLGMFEQASSNLSRRDQHGLESSRKAWEADRKAERLREDELASGTPPPPGGRAAEGYRVWEDSIREQARRDVVRAKWASGDLPEAYQHRLPHLHARSFVRSLAQLGRALKVFAKLETGPAKAETVAARDDFFAALPSLVPVRDSIEHAEDRMRSLDKYGKPLALQPVTNSFINAPGGGVLVGDSLNGRLCTCTIDDGSCAEVEVSDATVEHARAATQRVLDALPWREMGSRHYTPHK